MKFLESYNFSQEDIQEFENNTPKKIKKNLADNIALVEENLKYLFNLGVNTYKEIFINYPDMFLLDNSNFVEIFSKYETDDLIERLNTNFKLVEYL